MERFLMLTLNEVVKGSKCKAVCAAGVDYTQSTITLGGGGGGSYQYERKFLLFPNGRRHSRATTHIKQRCQMKTERHKLTVA